MPHTDITEKGLETIMVEYLRNHNGYEQGQSADFDREYTLDPGRVERFIRSTQPDKVEQTMCFGPESQRRIFFRRLSDKIASDGITNVLRKGFRFNGLLFDLYYPIPSELNPSAIDFYQRNIFSVTRQLHHSTENALDALDVCIFINGFPIITAELKNHYTGQTVKNAIKQYQDDRPATDPLFAPRRCAVHFAVDDEQIMMCSELKGKDSWFLPFNKGVNGGAGNPWRESKILTEYLWQEVLTKDSLADILENYAQVIEKEEEGKPKPVKRVIWPRYHQLDCVRKLLFETRSNPIGQRFLIQHSAGSGKSNTITWLAYQLVTLVEDDENIVDSVIVVTDRINLDKQIRGNITAFKRLSNIVAWAEDSASLKEALQGGKKIIITTIHKFQFILDTICGSLGSMNFAIIIDEAHSSQNGAMSADMNIVVSGNSENEEEDIEDRILKIIKGRKMAPNVNYYAFTATPKNKTLEMFGTPVQHQDGQTGHIPFHEYTMKQAIEEGFIMDVLRNYTPYKSYYKIIKSIEADPKFDKNQASKKMRGFVERQPQTIKEKSLIIVNHFLDKVIGAHKVGGQARAMVVTSSIIRAIEFYYAITKQLEEMHSPYKAIVAFSGEKEYCGKMVTEAIINGFPSSEIEKKIEKDPYRILVVANKFQTGYDQPLLHTMYVDKQLSDVKAVQTLSRLNRCHPKKKDTFILDFANDPEVIQRAFQTYYKGTSLSHETDPNKLNDLIEIIEDANIYTDEDVIEFNRLYWTSAPREDLDAIINRCVARFKEELSEEQQIKCKSAIKSYVRTYPFLAAVMPFISQEWEKLYHFYYYLGTKLPKLAIDDWTEGLIESIDFDKYRIVEQEEVNLSLSDSNAEIDPVPVTIGGGKPEPQMESLSKIIEDFNTLYGGIEWEHADTVRAQIQQLPGLLAKSESFVNAVHNSDSDTAQLQCNTDLFQIVINMMAENTEFARNYLDNETFRNFVNSRVFQQASMMV